MIKTALLTTVQALIASGNYNGQLLSPAIINDARSILNACEEPDSVNEMTRLEKLLANDLGIVTAVKPMVDGLSLVLDFATVEGLNRALLVFEKYAENPSAPVDAHLPPP